jgi:hypothetical protein
MNFMPHRTWFGDTRTHEALFKVLKHNPAKNVKVDMQKMMELEEGKLMELFERKQIDYWQLQHVELESKGGRCLGFAKSK